MNEQRNKLGMPSNIENLKVGDKVYTSDFTFDGDKEYFADKTFVIDKVKSSSIDGKKVSYYEMHDERFPKAVVKSDLKTGYFLSIKEAQQAFVDMISHINEAAHKVFKENFPEEGN